MDEFKPRQVEKPFLSRWVGTTFRLLLGCPVTFGVAIALLATAYLLATEILRTRLVDAGATIVVGMLLLPALWIALSLLARQSDRPMGRSELLQHLAAGRLWAGGLLPGCLAAALSWLVHWALSGSPAIADLVGCNIWNTLLLVLPLGVCYFPLMALAPGLSILDACQLSKTASRMNGEWVIVMFVATLSLVADGLARALPLAGIVTAAFLVFVGVFNYVAYRDIFERRLEYAAQPVFAPQLRVPAPRRRPLYP